MTARYVTKPRLCLPDEEFTSADRPTITVIEDETGPIDTGLLDASGHRLFRVTEREPIGFALRGARDGAG